MRLSPAGDLVLLAARDYLTGTPSINTKERQQIEHQTRGHLGIVDGERRIVSSTQQPLVANENPCQPVSRPLQTEAETVQSQ